MISPHNGIHHKVTFGSFGNPEGESKQIFALEELRRTRPDSDVAGGTQLDREFGGAGRKVSSRIPKLGKPGR